MNITKCKLYTVLQLTVNLMFCIFLNVTEKVMEKNMFLSAWNLSKNTLSRPGQVAQLIGATQVRFLVRAQTYVEVRPPVRERKATDECFSPHPKINKK